MSGDPEIVLRATSPLLALRGVAPELMEPACKAYLEERGAVIHWPREWETQRAFCARLKISPMTLRRRMAERNCPPVPLDRAKNGKGRIRALAPTLEFEAFCLRHENDDRPRTETLEARLRRILHEHRRFLLTDASAIRLIERCFTADPIDQDFVLRVAAIRGADEALAMAQGGCARERHVMKA